ncbi:MULTISPECIES: porin family protein [Sphingobacterium]|uniref:porin family protein n=1 Tax=Sphingobacterium TaxID=28453 RepID=UPI0013DD335C|nr:MULTISPECIES: porin family protein [unclassified Sphingobacterium]
MKKVLLTLGVALLTAVGAQAQIGYGVKAGVNLGKYSNWADQQKNNTSFYVTGFADLPVASQFSIQPGVSLQGKGAKVEVGNSDNTLTRNVMSIEVPVNAVYYIPTGASGSVFLGAGPYVGFNVSGKDKIKGNVGNLVSYTGDTDLKIGSDKDIKLFDAGANFMLGYKMNNGFLINAGYNLGMTDINPKVSDTQSNRVWSFGIGFQL